MKERLCNSTDEKYFGELFPWKTMSPAEYAARHSHLIGEFTLDRRQYPDPGFNQWISALGSILSSSLKVQECRQQYLTPAERADIDEFLDEISRHPERF